MRNLIYILFIIPLIALGQSPQGVNYQAVAYDSDGFELSNKEVGVRISIVEGSAYGNPQIVEEHDVVTTEQGLFSLIIGQGALLGGEVESLLDIPWGSNTYFLKIELDVENNGSYMDFGTQQFMSVPYALYAESSGTPGPEGPGGPPGEPADPVDYDSLSNMVSLDSTFLASVAGMINASPNIMYYPSMSNNYYVIPNGISIVDITLVGGKGGTGGNNLLCNANSGNSSGGDGGIGGMINFLLPCNAGDSLYINVGDAGSSGSNATSECVNGTSGSSGISTTAYLNGVLVATAYGGVGGGGGNCLCGYYGNTPGGVGGNGTTNVSSNSVLEMEVGINNGAKAIIKF